MSNGIIPKSALYSSRLGMTNKYAHDYACEDEFFEREMTLLEAKTFHLPIPEDFKHKELPVDEIQPPHWNDVRFNFLPQNLDRRCYIHDTMAITYNMQEDYMHGVGYQDEDLDYEMPDPYSNMHFKNKRSPVVMFMGAFVSVAIVIGYPTLGLKMPQKDNPIMMRKKYGTTTTIQQFQQLAMVEYGNNIPKNPETNVMYTNKGFQMVGNGIRIDLDSYNDLVC
tara:strand:- start:36 stop:704 length:669 start_codon:yes stop_codon:yes gene_type:complete